MADRVRKLIPDRRTLERKRALPVRFSSSGWDTKQPGVSRRAKLSGRCVKMKKIGDVGRSKARDRFETNESNFVFNPFINREPV